MWRNLNINKNQIEAATGRAVLIKMPNNSAFAGYKFWHPAKLVRSGLHRAALEMSYTEEFTFKLFKNGNGKYNAYEVVAREEISYEELEEAFGVTSENITPKMHKNEYETHKPSEVSPIDSKVDSDLKDE